jgi:hypothetical protein
MKSGNTRTALTRSRASRWNAVCRSSGEAIFSTVSSMPSALTATSKLRRRAGCVGLSEWSSRLIYKSPPERREPRLCFRIVLGEAHQHGDASHSITLLRARRKRPCDGCVANDCD